MQILSERHYKRALSAAELEPINGWHRFADQKPEPGQRVRFRLVHPCYDTGGYHVGEWCGHDLPVSCFGAVFRVKGSGFATLDPQHTYWLPA